MIGIHKGLFLTLSVLALIIAICDIKSTQSAPTTNSDEVLAEEELNQLNKMKDEELKKLLKELDEIDDTRNNDFDDAESSDETDLVKRNNQKARDLRQQARWDFGFGKRAKLPNKSFMDAIYGKRSYKFGRRQHWDTIYGK